MMDKDDAGSLLRIAAHAASLTPVADAPQDEDEPTRTPRPPTPCERYQPRDRYGQPIPRHRWELLTLKQRLAAYGYGATDHAQESAFVAAAIAEEEELIAAQNRDT